MVHASEEDRQAIREAIRKICAAFPDAYWRDIDKAGAYPQAFVDALTASGYLANWTTDDPGFPPGVGGAMDLAVGAKEIRVLVEHTTKAGVPRIRRNCQYPLTAAGVVRQIYTDLAVIDVTPRGLMVREMVEDIDFPALQAKTEAALRAAPDLRALRVPVA